MGGWERGGERGDVGDVAGMWEVWEMWGGCGRCGRCGRGDVGDVGGMGDVGGVGGRVEQLNYSHTLINNISSLSRARPTPHKSHPHLCLDHVVPLTAQ